MFRKPRDDVAQEFITALTPSVGRPPSPPNSSTSSSLPSPQAWTPMAAKTTPSRLPVIGRQPFVKPGSNTLQKSGSRANGSILNFFKKKEDEGLFIGAGTMKDIGQREDSSQIYSLLEDERDENEDIVGDEDSRFNEQSQPNKRIKIDHDVLQNVLDSASKPFDKTGDAMEQSNRCTPSPPLPSETPENNEDKAKGPFVDDSDSESDEPFELEKLKSSPTRRMNMSTALRDDQPHQTEKVPLLDVKQEEDGESEGTFEPPLLRREGTSYAEQDNYGDFDGMDDFDAEYAEGEEYVERKWMMEQRRLEIEAGVYEGDDVDDSVCLDRAGNDEQREIIETKEVAEAVCPVCNISFAGVSDQEASVHVNHCLDGNPTPLPTKRLESAIKQEVKQESPGPTAKQFKRAIRPAKPGQENPFQLGSIKGTSSAFSQLMSGHTEETAWAMAAAAEQAARGKPAYQRTCPFYKILPGFYTCVDAFRYGAVEGCNAYFLSHFHSDHYVGLTATWSHGPIYCSRVTANLVRQQLRVDARYVVDLEFEERVEIPDTQGVFVTMIPANHCPGSSIYLFEKEVVSKGQNPKVQRVLHCGDFRACPAHVEHPLLRPEVVDKLTGKTMQQKIDVCYLDTTYLNPRYAFPSQEDVIQACADMCVSLNKTKPDENDEWEQMMKTRGGGSMTNFIRKDSKDASDPASTSSTSMTASTIAAEKQRGPLLVIVGTYSIGKERICLGIARALNSKIYAPPGKLRICACLEDPELNVRLTSNPRDAQVHMTPLFEIRAETLGDYLADYGDRFSRAVGFRPSGWNYRPPGSRFTDSPAVATVLHSDNWKSGYGLRDLQEQRGSTRRAKCFGVPYSEHSSFRELTMFCCALHIEKVIPTVNVGSAKSREKMKMWCDRWTMERKKAGLFRVNRGQVLEGSDAGLRVTGEGEDGEAGGGAGAGTPALKRIERIRSDWYPGKGTWELRTTL